MSYQKSEEDALPKVIICGTSDDHSIPKLIVCDDKKFEENRTCGAKCNKKDPNEAVPPNLPQKIMNMQRPLVANPGIAKLECDLMLKNQTIENLQQQLCCLQCEMQNIAVENAMLVEKIQQATCSLEQNRAPPCGSKNFAGLESRLNEYTENTKALEKQLCEMENHMEAMKTALSTVQAERTRLEKKNDFVMICPPTGCPHQVSACLPPGCPQFSVCPSPSCPPPQPPSCQGPRFCSFRRAVSDQQLGNLKQEYSVSETTSIFKKFSQKLADLIK